MLRLIIVALVAGVCSGQDQGEFSDCDTVASIGSKCAAVHLDYLKSDPNQYNQMQMISQIVRPVVFMGELDTICNDTMHLKQHYQCVFSNVSTCLEDKNSTQLHHVPDVNRISMGIVDLCKDRSDINKTCLMTKVQEVLSCTSDFGKDEEPSPDHCEVSLRLITCGDKMTACEGGDKMKDFLISARPRSCPYTDSALQYLPSVLLIVGMLLVHFISF